VSTHINRKVRFDPRGNSTNNAVILGKREKIKNHGIEKEIKRTQLKAREGVGRSKIEKT